MAYKLTNMLN